MGRGLEGGGAGLNKTRLKFYFIGSFKQNGNAQYIFMLLNFNQFEAKEFYNCLLHVSPLVQYAVAIKLRGHFGLASHRLSICVKICELKGNRVSQPQLTPRPPPPIYQMSLYFLKILRTI